MTQDLPNLIQECIKQNRKAEYALYRYCFKFLMPVCYRYLKNEDDAAEILNKAFLKILLNLETYNREKQFEKWAKAITVNTIIDEFRMNKKRNLLFAQVAPEDVQPYYHPFNLNEAEAKLTAEDVHKHIQLLPESSKVVFNLFVFEGYSHKEIAQQLNISEGTSKWHLSHARQILKAQLSKIFPNVKEKIEQYEGRAN